MSRIDDLIKKHCPDGVEYMQLSKIGSFYGGLTGKTKADFSDGNAKYIPYKNVFSNISVDIEMLDIVKVNQAEKQNEVKFGDVLFTGSSENTEECGMSSVLVQAPEGKLYLNSFCFGFRLNDEKMFLPAFSKYLYRDINLRKEIIKTANGVTRFNISKKYFAKIKIPVPQIKVQEEIVRILDTFTKLEAELKAELKARQQQYSHYRDEMLSFGGQDIALTRINSVCLKTSNIQWKENVGKEYDYIDLSSVDRENNQITKVQKINNNNAPSRAQQIVSEGDVIFGTTRPTLKRFCFITKEYDGQICSTGFCILRADKKRIMPKYLYFSITTSAFNDYIERQQEGTSYPAISDTKVKKFEIPIPSLEEQERIVTILDKFDALVNDLSVGLPAEIEARRQQYEHYRNQLLTFKEAC